MAGAFTFIHRGSNISDNLKVTGFTESAPKGNNGENGEPGSSLYFIDYNPSNSYYKELALKRIEKNYVLSSNKAKKLTDRAYRIGDIIMSQDLNMYRLIEADEYSKYSFDLEYIGTLNEDKETDEVTIADSIVSVQFADFESTTSECLVPVNRSFDFDASIYGKYKINKFQPDSLSNIFDCSIYVTDPKDASTWLRYPDSGGGTTVWKVPEYSYTDYGVITEDQLIVKFTYGIMNSINAAIWANIQNDPTWDHFDSSSFNIYTSGNELGIEVPSIGKYFVKIETKMKQNSGTPFTSSNFLEGMRYYSTGPEFHDMEDIYYQANANGIKAESDGKYCHSASYQTAFRTLYGLKFYPSIQFGLKSTSSILTDFDYYLRIYLKNTKTIQDNNFSLNPGVSDDFSQNSPADPASLEISNNFVFYKVMELKLDVLNDDASTNHRQNYNISRKSFMHFVSDMALDKFHPSGNNIEINSMYPGPNNMSALSTYGVWGLINYDQTNGTYDAYAIKSPNTSSNNEMLNMYGKQQKHFYNSSYALSHQSIQYSKRNDEYPCPINSRGGESAYFSGMTVPVIDTSCFIQADTQTNLNSYSNKSQTYSTSTYDEYVSNIMSTNRNICVVQHNFFGKQAHLTDWNNSVDARIDVTRAYVTKKMEEFLLSKDNKYEVVCVDKKNKIGNIMIIPIDYTQLSKS